MRRIITAFLMLAIPAALYSQKNREKEKEFIKQMCGCYEVSFEYAETFSPRADYEFHDRYRTGGLEWIFVEEEGADKLVLQHLLVINDSMIIKHWRQDWLYENTSVFTYEKNLEWKKTSRTEKDVKGTWTQKVYQVDDSPRYEGISTWIENDGKIYWESEVDAPLPRREFTKRSDYNVMRRNNKHELTASGHIHELDNTKIIRSEAGDDVLVYEKGMNTYKKVDDRRCNPALEWWEDNKAYWADVRSVWNDIFNQNDYLNIRHKVEDKKLWESLFELGNEYASAESYNNVQARKDIRQVIDVYLTNEPSGWTSVHTKKEAQDY